MNISIAEKKITLVYKQSRLSYAQAELKNLSNIHGAIIQELTEAHESNLRCIDYIKSVLDSMGKS